jgi:DNA mismatch endonuclease (patch repair protein)
MPKIEENKRRDRRNLAALRAKGWRVLSLWQCQIEADEALRERLLTFLGPPGMRRNESEAISQ